LSLCYYYHYHYHYYNQRAEDKTVFQRRLTRHFILVYNDCYNNKIILNFLTTVSLQCHINHTPSTEITRKCLIAEILKSLKAWQGNVHI